jgi:NTE family protein
MDQETPWTTCLLTRMLILYLEWIGKGDEIDYREILSGENRLNPIADPKAFEAFREKFLFEDNEGKIAWRLFANPVNWFRVPFTDFDRTDVAARYYAGALFSHATFAALPDHPRLIINASDLVTGSRFEFAEEYFRCLGSDLRQYPLSYAVAASSAYPVGLAAVTLKNFGQEPERCLTVSDRNNLRSQHLNPEGWLRAIRKERFLAHDRVPYVHLVDGGITDNLGVAGILERLRDGEISDLLNTRRVKSVVMILVNAMPAHDLSFGQRSDSPSILNVASQAFGLMLEQASTRTSSEFQAAMNERRAFEKKQGRDTSLYFLEVRLSDLENPTRRDRLLTARTRLTLPPETTKDLIDAGRDLLYCGGGKGRNAAILREIVAVFYKQTGKPVPPTAGAAPASFPC